MLAHRYAWGWHLMEPIVLYEYADRLNGDPVPQFDEVDLLSDKNMLTYGVSNRLKISDEVRTLFRFTQSANFDRSQGSSSH